MKNFKTILLIAILTLTTACQKDKENLSENTSTENINALDTINDSKQDSITTGFYGAPLESFGALAEIQNCSCYFARSKSDFQQKKYIYADDYGNNAYIKTNGKMLQISMQEGDFDLDEFERHFENNDYTFEMKGKKQESNADQMIYHGEMVITNKKNGAKLTSTLYGECDC